MENRLSKNFGPIGSQRFNLEGTPGPFVDQVEATLARHAQITQLVSLLQSARGKTAEFEIPRQADRIVAMEMER